MKLKDKLKVLNGLLSRVSYFEAAEGSYGSEAEARNSNLIITKNLMSDLIDNGMTAKDWLELDISFLGSIGGILDNEHQDFNRLVFDERQRRAQGSK